jgi:plastocyanin
MSSTQILHSTHRPGALVAALAAAALALAACTTYGPSPSSEPSSEPSSTASESAAPSQAGTARCEVTTDATAAATVNLASFAFDSEPTISAGEAVTFVNQDAASHTVTEGTEGAVADDSCVNARVNGGQSVTITFNEPGDYQITCVLHPSMQTIVHVE